MGESRENRNLLTDEGIVAEASLDVLRKAAERVLFEFNEVLIDKDGKVKPRTDDIKVGDTLLFKEDVEICPAEIVVVMLNQETWYIISTSEAPKGGYPSGVEATRAAQAEEKKLRLVKEFLSRSKGVKKVEDVQCWEPDMRAEAADVLDIINSASRKWRH